ncbi:MAG: preprotein translocase subunit SecG [Gemmatimonadaceae bacterium]
MYAFLLSILVLVSIALVGVVLLQAGKGGGIAASFGGASSSSDAFMGTRQTANVLTKASWWLGGVFLGLTLILQIVSTRAAVPRSILDAPASQQQTAPPTTTAPAVPLTPAPTQQSPAVPLTPPPAPRSDQPPAPRP